jgi:hypothetical protein
MGNREKIKKWFRKDLSDAERDMWLVAWDKYRPKSEMPEETWDRLRDTLPLDGQEWMSRTVPKTFDPDLEEFLSDRWFERAEASTEVRQPRP